MAKITISMPDPMSDYVATRIASGQYGNVSEYFRDLVRRDQERRSAVVELRHLIDEGLASGMSEEGLDGIWDEALARRSAESD